MKATPDIKNPASFLHPKWISKVANTREIDLRGHRTALTYWQLATFLDDLVNDQQSVHRQLKKGNTATRCNVNWFHFAAWSTTTITRNIANQRPPQRIDTLPSEALRRHLTPAVIQVRAAAGQRVSRALSWGQRLIFVASALALHALHEWDKTQPRGDPDDFILGGDDATTQIRNQILKLGTWNGCPWIDDKRHLVPITHAYGYYLRARRAFRTGRKDQEDTAARWILGANVLLARADQDLIDPAIEAVVNHVPQALAGRVDQTVARWVERSRGVPSQITTLRLPYRLKTARATMDTAWSRLMTDQVLVMALPTETLRIGRDVPPRYPGQPYFPRQLQRIRTEGVPDLDDVAEMIECLDRTTGNGRGSAARDWRRWDERMNWAVNLMRSRQQDDTLFWAPYANEDQERIIRGELPRRAGDASALEVQGPGDAVAFAMAANGGAP